MRSLGISTLTWDTVKVAAGPSKDTATFAITFMSCILALKGSVVEYHFARFCSSLEERFAVRCSNTMCMLRVLPSTVAYMT